MRRSISLFMLVLLAQSSPVAHAYDRQTHREISELTAGSTISSVDEVLKQQLGLSEGIIEKFPGRSIQGLRTVQKLIGDGAFSEDVPDTRSLNHFHNPIMLWDQAGLRVGLQLAQSSVLWQQNTNQNRSIVLLPPLFLPLPSPGGSWSWQDARQHYLDALTRPMKEDRGEEQGRDAAFAAMFETLGHLTHLIQDASVPAHVRNDAHLPILNPDWYEDWVKEARESDPSLFQGLLNGYNKDLHRPPFSLFMPTENPQAPVPIARLLDSDKFLGTNFPILTDPDLGISEYTNGNFLSRDTIFTDFNLPRQTSLDPSFIVEPVGAKFRRYLQKVSEGETVRHFVTEGLLYTTLKEAVGADPVPAGGWTLDDKNVHVDYAGKLLPRAVGYSAALLDYFFRGKLDVDLVEDPNDPSVFRLTGTNASTEPLVAGTLTLFADDPNGLRSQVVALDQTNVTGISPGQGVSSARFQAPENAERFVAVYQGTLGQEVKPQDPNAPGAVIGKVLGGVRVEEVFSDGTRWKIRTPRGVFALPLTVAEFKDVKWGDADNTLLAQTPFGPGQPNRFVVYEVQRQPGSVEFKTLTTPDGSMVEVTKKRDIVFPFGMPLDTTVQFSHTIQYRQFLLRHDGTFVSTWFPLPRGYVTDHYEIGPVMVETVGAQTVPFNLSFAISLDLDQSFDFGFHGVKPYAWQLWDVGVDASGRLVGTVVVSLIDPKSPTVDLPIFGVNAQGGLDIIRYTRLGPSFPQEVDPLLWALVDLSEGRGIASTADPVITISRQEFRDLFSTSFSATHLFQRRDGGPQAGLADIGWASGALFRVNKSTPIATTAELPIQGGDQAISVEGWLRPELKDELSRAGLFSFQPSSGRSSDELVYDCAQVSNNGSWSTVSCNAVRIVTTDMGIFPHPATLDDAQRSRFAPDGERMVFLAEGVSEGLEETTAALVWDPGTLRAQFLPLPKGFQFLRAATRATAMVTTGFCWPGCTSSILISLEGAPSSAVFSGVELSESFTLLEPSLLYSTRDRKFYSAQPPLRRTALPATLADVPGNPIGDYHAIRVP